MTYATLLVPVEADPEIDHRLALAIDLANRFDARLIGVGAETWRIVAGGGDLGGGYLAATLAAETERVEGDLERAKVKFQRSAGAVRQGSEWRSAARLPVAEIAGEARAADLLVTSHSTLLGAGEHNVAAPGALVLQAGRPVLVAPAEADKLEAERIVVAWKDTREARRAVADALPFLKRASAVVLTEVCDHEDAAGAQRRLDYVARALRRHGVNPSTAVCVEQKNVRAAQQLLDFADAHDAGLIVAGGYGHSRSREWVFGGFTRALLAQTSRAVLLSH
jgi:nucleotide-binding universal stress UspA family protein